MLRLVQTHMPRLGMVQMQVQHLGLVQSPVQALVCVQEPWDMGEQGYTVEHWGALG